MNEAIGRIIAQAEQELKAAPNLPALDAVRVKYLGKKGELTAILKGDGRPFPRGAQGDRTGRQ